MCVEVWILFESKTPFVLESTEVPQNFCQAWIFIEYHWRLNQFMKAKLVSQSPLFTVMGFLSGSDLRMRKLISLLILTFRFPFPERVSWKRYSNGICPLSSMNLLSAQQPPGPRADILLVLSPAISLVTMLTEVSFMTGELEGRYFKPRISLITPSRLSAASDILASVSIMELSTSSTSCDTL